MKNPALRKEKRYQPAPVIPLTQDESLLDWLEANNRIIYRSDEKDYSLVDIELSEEEEIVDLIEGEDDDFETDLELDSSEEDDSDLM
jgi:hypothetical protein